MNLWVGPADDIARAVPVTQDRGRGVQGYAFAASSDYLVYLQDNNGDENWHVFALDLANGKAQELTKGEKVRAQILKISPRFPHQISITTNERDPEVGDVYTIDIKTGKAKLVFKNVDSLGDFEVDDSLRPRVASKITSSGGTEFRLLHADGTSKPLFEVGVADQLTTRTVSLDASGKTLYLLDSRDRDTVALKALDLETGQSKVLATDESADIVDVDVHPTTYRPQAATSNPGRTTWWFFDKGFESDLKILRGDDRRDVRLTSRTLDDRKWIVQYSSDDGPSEYVLFDRTKKKKTSLFVDRPELVGKKLSQMHVLRLKARDGLDLPAYLSLPPDVDGADSPSPSQPLPMVLLVHGGPWSRDEWGYDSLHQHLASRGYAVLSVNFRASTGFGKRFVNAGDREWYGKMQDDLVDAVRWAIDTKLANPARIAIMGGSYGGYATLAGLTKTPELFACGVDLVGISNLITFIESFPPYWNREMSVVVARIGNPATEEGKKDLLARSPLTHADEIRKPLLVAQGKHDPRVNERESAQIVQKLQRHEVPVTYLLYEDEGHGFARPENMRSFIAITEKFLAQCLGGRYQEIGSDDLKGSSVHVEAGIEHIQGLSSDMKD